MFSIIIATHNRPNMLIDAINSVLLQNLSDIEIIVVNDGSVQNYDEVISQFSHLISSGKINYIHQPKSSGVSVARNIAATHATKPWIVFLDDDDLFAENYLKNLKSTIENDKLNSEFYWGDVNIIDIDAHGNIQKTVIEYPAEFSNEKELTKSVLSIGTSYGVAIKKITFQNLGGFDESFTVCEDLDLIIRLLDSGAKLKAVGSLAVIKHQEHTDRLSHQFAKYSESNVYEKIFSKHDSFFRRNPDHYLELYTWSMKVHLQNNHIENILNSIIDEKTEIF